jgi:hypothetical protein
MKEINEKMVEIGIKLDLTKFEKGFVYLLDVIIILAVILEILGYAKDGLFLELILIQIGYIVGIVFNKIT